MQILRLALLLESDDSLELAQVGVNRLCFVAPTDRIGDISMVIRFIRAAKELGFSLREVSELVSLCADAVADAGSARRQAEASGSTNARRWSTVIASFSAQPGAEVALTNRDVRQSR